MGNGIRIGELALRLGLKYACTKTTDDAALCPLVATLYCERLIQIVARYCHLSNAEVLASKELKEDVNELLGEFGPRVWPQNGVRDWLYNPTEVGSKDAYPRRLQYADPQDRQVIHDSFWKIAIAKTIRRRKEIRIKATQEGCVASKPAQAPYPDFNAGSGAGPSRSAPGSSNIDQSWTRLFDSISTPLSTRLDTNAASTQAKDAAQSHMVCSHLDFERLQQLRVWLGDWDDHDAVVGDCLSWNEFCREWSRRTDSGMADDDEGLRTLGLRRENRRRATCAECAEAFGTAKPKSRFWMLFCKQISLESDDLPARDRRMVWTFPFELNGRRLFAIVNHEGRKIANANYYSFWTRRGKYTNDIEVGLVTADRRSTIGFDVQHANGSGKRPRSKSNDDYVYSETPASSIECGDWHSAERQESMGYMPMVHRPPTVEDVSSRNMADEAHLGNAPSIANMEQPSSPTAGRPNHDSQKLPSGAGHQEDTVPVAHPHPRLDRAHRVADKDQEPPATHSSKRVRREEQPLHSSNPAQPTAPSSPVTAPQHNLTPSIRASLHLKDSFSTFVIDLNGIDSIQAFFTRIADTGRLQQLIGDPARIQYVVVGDWDRTFEYDLDADSVPGFEELMDDAQGLMRTAVDGKVKLMGEIELRE